MSVCVVAHPKETEIEDQLRHQLERSERQRHPGKLLQGGMEGALVWA